MTARATNYNFSLEVKFHDRCKCNRHGSKKTRVYINTRLTHSDDGTCVEEKNYIVLCRLRRIEEDVTIEWEHGIPELVMDEVIKMYSEEDIIKIFEELPVRKKF